MIDPLYPITSLNNDGVVQNKIASDLNDNIVASQNNSIVLGGILLVWNCLEPETSRIRNFIIFLKSLFVSTKKLFKAWIYEVSNFINIYNRKFNKYASIECKYESEERNLKNEDDNSTYLVSNSILDNEQRSDDNGILDSNYKHVFTDKKLFFPDDIFESHNSYGIKNVTNVFSNNESVNEGKRTSCKYENVKNKRIKNRIIKKNIIKNIIAYDSNLMIYPKDNLISVGFHHRVTVKLILFFKKIIRFFLILCLPQYSELHVKNITSRSQSVFSLLFFPAVINQSNGGPLVDLVELTEPLPARSRNKSVSNSKALGIIPNDNTRSDSLKYKVDSDENSFSDDCKSGMVESSIDDNENNPWYQNLYDIGSSCNSDDNQKADDNQKTDDSDKKVNEDDLLSDSTSSSLYEGYNTLEENEFYILKYGCGFSEIWEPRLILYGGTTSGSLGNPEKNLSFHLTDFLLYSLVPDEDTKENNTLKSNLDSVYPSTNTTYRDIQNNQLAKRSRNSNKEISIGQNGSKQYLHVIETKNEQLTPNGLNENTQNNNFNSNDSKIHYIYRLNSTLFDKNNIKRDALCNDSSASFNKDCLNWSSICENSQHISKNTVDVHIDLNSPTPRFGCASVVYRGRLYIFGGAGVLGSYKPVLMNDLWVLLPEVQESYNAFHLSNKVNTRNVAGYHWREIRMDTQIKPPPCAFHLADVYDGFMYVLISDCVIPDNLENPYGWVTRFSYNLNEGSDTHKFLIAQYNHGQKLNLKPHILNAYKKRVERGKKYVNELWRIDLDCCTYRWEKLNLTFSKQLTSALEGAITMTFYSSRLFVYGTATGYPYAAIGVIDVSVLMWVTFVKLPGAPIWVTGVSIGKLWLLFGVETWGIFNFETFEWRYAPHPIEAKIKFGCNSVWLPPYLPYPPLFELSSSKKMNRFNKSEYRTMQRTDLASQYFWLMQQRRRPYDNVHTILFIGGYNSQGQLSNQIDQISLYLPPNLAENCFFPVRKEADLLYTSLFGIYRQSHNTEVKKKKRDIHSTSINEDYSQLASLLLEEINRLKLQEESRLNNEDHLLRKMQFRFFSRQRQLYELIHEKDKRI